jgi:hypothetical protein
MNPEQQRMLSSRLELAFGSSTGLKAWLDAYLPEARAYLNDGSLREQLLDLMWAANAQDGMRTLLQALASDPPQQDIPGMVYAFTQGEVMPRPAWHGGWPDVPPHERWFVNNRPFVNRRNLRSHLQQLPHAQGAATVLVIEGDRHSGKSLAMALAMGAPETPASRFAFNIDDYARFSLPLNARELAEAIVRTSEGCPAFDITKEKASIPQLMRWIVGQLTGRREWIIIDHCNRSVLTEGARTILHMLVEKLRDGHLPGIRLVLADFNRDEMPQAWRDSVRYDRATLPDRQHVEDWLRQMATASRRRCEDADLARWAADVYDGLDAYDRSDIGWYVEFERRLMAAADYVKACREAA